MNPTPPTTATSRPFISTSSPPARPAPSTRFPTIPALRITAVLSTALAPSALTGKFLLQTATATSPSVSNFLTAPIGITGGFFGSDDNQIVYTHAISSDAAAPVGIYSYDIATGISTLLTLTPSGPAADGKSYVFDLSSGSHATLIGSTSTDLASNSPTDGSNNLYLISAIPSSNAPTLPAPQQTASLPSQLPPGGILSNDGQHVAYITGAARYRGHQHRHRRPRRRLRRRRHPVHRTIHRRRQIPPLRHHQHLNCQQHPPVRPRLPLRPPNRQNRRPPPHAQFRQRRRCRLHAGR